MQDINMLRVALLFCILFVSGCNLGLEYPINAFTYSGMRQAIETDIPVGTTADEAARLMDESGFSVKRLSLPENHSELLCYRSKVRTDLLPEQWRVQITIDENDKVIATRIGAIGPS